jgi:transposase-like protein
MAKKNPANPTLAAIRKAASNEAAAYAFLEAQRWGDSPACPLCGSVNVYPMRDRKTGERQKHYRWRCRDCSKMYSVRTGTVMEESRIRLHVWMHAFWRACASKKAISAHQIARECEITPKSALFLMHRIRLAMASDPSGQPLLGGIVEADETFVGGKPRYKTTRREAARLRRDNKQIVFAMLERGGRVRASHVPRIHAGNLRRALQASVDPSARVMTDEAKYYQRLGKHFAHETVNHRKREYVRGDVSTNQIECFFGLFKRAIYGTHHSVSPHHLHRYVSEAEFRWNHRAIDDGERTLAAIRGAEGKRLLYREPLPA